MGVLVFDSSKGKYTATADLVNSMCASIDPFCRIKRPVAKHALPRTTHAADVLPRLFNFGDSADSPAMRTLKTSWIFESVDVALAQFVLLAVFVH